MAASVSLPVSSFFSVVSDGNLVPLNTSRNYMFFPLRFKNERTHAYTLTQTLTYTTHTYTPQGQTSGPEILISLVWSRASVLIFFKTKHTNKNKKLLQNHEHRFVAGTPSNPDDKRHFTSFTSDFQNQVDRVVSTGHRTINVKWQPYNLEKLFSVSVASQEPA